MNEAVIDKETNTSTPETSREKSSYNHGNPDITYIFKSVDSPAQQIVLAIEGLREQNYVQHRVLMSKLDELIKIISEKERQEVGSLDATSVSKPNPTVSSVSSSDIDDKESATPEEITERKNKLHLSDSPAPTTPTPTVKTLFWNCKNCCLRNDVYATMCIACQAPAPDASVQNQSLLSETFEAASTSWICDICCQSNSKFAQRCISCVVPKYPLIPTEAFVFSGRKSVDSKFIFTLGTPQKQKVVTKENTSLIYVFSAVPKVLKEVKYIQRGRRITRRFLRQSIQHQDDQVHFQKKSSPVPLPRKDEEVVFCHRAKLSRYESVTKEWRPSVTGDIKLLKCQKTEKFRLVMSRKGLKTYLNHAVTTSLQITPHDDKTWMWTAGDYNEGEIEFFQFACSFQTCEIARQFKAIIDNACKVSDAILLNKDPNVIAKSSSESDIEIIYELKVTPEERATALKLQLPQNFYAYKYKDGCQGCRGCGDLNEPLYTPSSTERIFVRDDDASSSSTTADVFSDKDENGSTDQHISCASDNLDTVKFLVDTGADINVKDNVGRTVLHSATEHGNLDMVKLLISKGVDVNAKNYKNETALHSACAFGSLDMIKFLVGRGADVQATDNNDWTALHFASNSGTIDSVQFLVEKGVDLHAKDDDGWIALHIACVSGNLAIVKFLVEKGADVHAKDKNGWTVLHIACVPNNLNIMKFLIDAGADANIKDNVGRTVLHSATERGDLDIVKLLIHEGADVNASDFNNETALHSACMFCRLHIVKFLVEKGADVHVKNKNGWTALHIACMTDNLQVVQFLVEKGANIHAKDNDGWIVLHIACVYGSLQIVKFLEKKGVDINTKTKLGKRPLEYARDFDYMDIVNFLVGKEAENNFKDSNTLDYQCSTNHSVVT